MRTGSDDSTQRKGQGERAWLRRFVPSRPTVPTETAELRSLIEKVSEKDKRAELTAKLIELRNARRTAWLQFVAATFVLVGAGTAAWVTFGQINQAQQQNRIMLEGQVTDRYTKAIGQLGHRELDVRLGGMFALERIARDSPKDRLTVYEVLTAYVRRHSPWPPSQRGQLPGDTPVEKVPALQVRAPDIQSAVTVLARREVNADDPALDLSYTDLRKANLERAPLQRAYLTGAQLQGADLERAQLQEAELVVAHLQGADLYRAQLDDVNLDSAQLQEANLDSAQLQEANLYGARLQEANLDSAQLQGANLRYAQLQGANFRARFDGRTDANLQHAKLQGAHVDAATQ